MSWGQWHYGHAELGADTRPARPYVGISVSPLLSCCPHDAGGSIPSPFSLLQCDGSSTLLCAPHGRTGCHLVPRCIVPSCSDLGFAVGSVGSKV